jgi:hypothetical protein
MSKGTVPFLLIEFERSAVNVGDDALKKTLYIGCGINGMGYRPARTMMPESREYKCLTKGRTVVMCKRFDGVGNHHDRTR